MEELAKELIGNIEHTPYYPKESGYHLLMQVETEDGIYLESIIEVTKYQDKKDGRYYFGIYSYATADGNPICEPGLDYTENCNQKELVEVLNYLAEDVLSPKQLKKMYKEYLENGRRF